MASPRPPKFLVDLEITVVSAKHLKNVNWRNGDLKPYAVAYIDPDRRSATKPDDFGSTRPVWNERLTLPLDSSSSSSSSSLILTVDVFHSKPSETPKPLVGTARVPLVDLVNLDDLSSSFPGIKTLDLRRPSGRPHGKVRIKVALRERPLPPPPPPQEQNYPIAPPAAYYYPTMPPPAAPHRDYRTYSPPQPSLGPHYSPSPIPSSQLQYVPYPGAFSDPYATYCLSAGGAGGGGYHSTAPPAAMPARPMYYERHANYGGPSAPVDYSSSSYEQQQQQQQQQLQKAKGSRMGLGAGLAVGAVAGTLGALALEEGIKYEEEKITDKVERDLASRDDYSDYREDY